MLENKQKLEEENKQDKILILSLVFILIFFVTTIFLIFSYTKICSASSASDLATAIGNMQQADETTYIGKVGRWMYGLIFVFLFILGLGMWWRIRENNDN